VCCTNIHPQQRSIAGRGRAIFAVAENFRLVKRNVNAISGGIHAEYLPWLLHDRFTNTNYFFKVLTSDIY
jgi:hypothetical protein